MEKTYCLKKNVATGKQTTLRESTAIRQLLAVGFIKRHILRSIKKLKGYGDYFGYTFETPKGKFYYDFFTRGVKE